MNSSFNEILDKCKDKTYVFAHKESLKQIFSRKSSIEQIVSDLNTKKNYFILSVLEKIDYNFTELIPNFENKKYINPYMYASMYWIYMKNYMSEESFNEIKEGFKCMKNYQKMFDDTTQHFLFFKIESDRKIQKLKKEDSIRVKNREEELHMYFKNLNKFTKEEIYAMNNISKLKDVYAIINVDKIFDISHVLNPEFRYSIGDICSLYKNIIGNSCYNIHPSEEESESSEGCISTKEDLYKDSYRFSKNYLFDKDSKYNKIEKIRNDYSYKFDFGYLFNKLDRCLNNKITNFYGNLLVLHRNSIEIFIVSECSLPQLISECTFFEFSCISLQNMYSLKGNKKKILEEILTKTGKNVILFGEEDFFAEFIYDHGLHHLTTDYLNLFTDYL